MKKLLLSISVAAVCANAIGSLPGNCSETPGVKKHVEAILNVR
jgi:hypothetical protein